MKTRIIFGAIMIAVLVGLLSLDWYLESASVISIQKQNGTQQIVRGLAVAVVMLTLAVLAVREMKTICGSLGFRVLGVSAFLGSAGMATLPVWWQFAGIELTGVTVILLLCAFVWMAFLEQMIRHRCQDAVQSLAGTFLTIMYLGLGSAMILQIRLLPTAGFARLILFLAAVKCTDIGAYFTGSMIGKHKLIPWLSPGKSWEGLIGGLATAAGVSLLINWIAEAQLTALQACLFGVIMGLVGQFGDLCESLLKRAAKVKDSGSAVPEFGGVLDIVDSPLIAAPLAYAFLAVIC